MHALLRVLHDRTSSFRAFFVHFLLILWLNSGYAVEDFISVSAAILWQFCGNFVAIVTMYVKISSRQGLVWLMYFLAAISELQLSDRRIKYYAHLGEIFRVRNTLSIYHFPGLELVSPEKADGEIIFIILSKEHTSEPCLLSFACLTTFCHLRALLRRLRHTLSRPIVY